MFGTSGLAASLAGMAAYPPTEAYGQLMQQAPYNPWGITGYGPMTVLQHNRALDLVPLTAHEVWKEATLVSGAKANPEPEEFSWLRARVKEVLWNP